MQGHGNAVPLFVSFNLSAFGGKYSGSFLAGTQFQLYQLR